MELRSVDRQGKDEKCRESYLDLPTLLVFELLTFSRKLLIDCCRLESKFINYTLIKISMIITSMEDYEI